MRKILHRPGQLLGQTWALGPLLDHRLCYEAHQLARRIFQGLLGVFVGLGLRMHVEHWRYVLQHAPHQTIPPAVEMYEDVVPAGDHVLLG